MLKLYKIYKTWLKLPLYVFVYTHNVPTIQNVYKLTFSEGKFPSILKLGKIFPVHKKVAKLK